MKRLMLHFIFSPAWCAILFGSWIALIIRLMFMGFTGRQVSVIYDVVPTLLLVTVGVLIQISYSKIIFDFFIHREELLWIGMDMEGAQNRAFRALSPFKQRLVKPVIEHEITLCRCKSKGFFPCQLHRPPAPRSKRELSI